MVVPNAGFDVDSGEWKTGSSTFLAPVKVLASLFRRRFLEEIAHLANPGAFHDTLAAARSKDWVVYAKRPFRGPEQVFRYLSRYTHRIAISDSRIVAFNGERVSFRHRKPARPGERKPRYGTATVGVDEFIRRFLLHVLPEGLHRIRHFGILANGNRARTLERARSALGTRGSTVDDGTANKTHQGNHERERDEEPNIVTAPVTCPDCGCVLRHVRKIPRQHSPHPPRGPPPYGVEP